jgi:hypothetical protein
MAQSMLTAPELPGSSVGIGGLIRARVAVGAGLDVGVDVFAGGVGVVAYSVAAAALVACTARFVTSIGALSPWPAKRNRVMKIRLNTAMMPSPISMGRRAEAVDFGCAAGGMDGA